MVTIFLFNIHIDLFNLFQRIQLNKNGNQNMNRWNNCESRVNGSGRLELRLTKKFLSMPLINKKIKYKYFMTLQQQNR